MEVLFGNICQVQNVYDSIQKKLHDLQVTAKDCVLRNFRRGKTVSGNPLLRELNIVAFFANV